jgi:predicted GIY-YIG superfamily endonuclease
MARRLEKHGDGDNAYYTSNKGYSFVRQGDVYTMIGAKHYIYKIGEERELFNRLAAKNKQLLAEKRIKNTLRDQENPLYANRKKMRKHAKRILLNNYALKRGNKKRTEGTITDNQYNNYGLA